MPNLDHKGPKGLGPKTGNKLGKCRKTETENQEIERGIHSGARRKREKINN